MSEGRRINEDMDLYMCFNKDDKHKVETELEEKSVNSNKSNTIIADELCIYQNSDIQCPSYLYSTSSDNDNVIDQYAPAFPIKECDEIKETKGMGYDSEYVLCYKEATNLENNLDVSKYNSVIREDKEKRKVILEWYKNNEFFSKQWSCKKFGKEGAAKRAIQFLEKIHGISVKCSSDGYYSTLFDIGCLRDKNSDLKKSILGSNGESKKYKKCKGRPKNESIITKNNSINDLVSDVLEVNNENNANENYISVIQRIMLFFLSIDILREYETVKEKNNTDNECIMRNSLHLNCRKLFRKLYQELLGKRNFNSSDKYDDKAARYDSDVGIMSNTGQNKTNIYKNSVNYHNNGNSLMGLKNVKDILQKTTKRDIQISNSLEDIKKIISTSEKLSNNESESQFDTSIWDELIVNVSRINDDLQYLSEGGLPGNTPVCSSKYGDGHFRFYRNGIIYNNHDHIEDLFKLINHNRSCLNLVHIGIERNGMKAITRSDKRVTRLQGKFHSNYISYDEKKNNTSTSNCSEILEHNSEIENAIYTLLDMKYGLKNLRSKDVLLLNLIDINDYNGCSSNINDENINIQVNETHKVSKTYERKRKINASICDEFNGNFLRDKKNKIIKKELDVNLKNVYKEKNSTLEWWKKPRGWKVSYYIGDQKCSQIFKVSLNSTNVERESQYKLAYEFFLSTKNNKELYINENANSQNIISTKHNSENIDINIGNKNNAILVQSSVNNNDQISKMNNTIREYGNREFPFIFNYMNIPQFNCNIVQPFNCYMPFLGYPPQPFGLVTQNFCLQLNKSENINNNNNSDINGLEINNNHPIQQDSGSFFNNVSTNNNKPSLHPNPQLFNPFFTSYLTNISYHNAYKQ